MEEQDKLELQKYVDTRLNNVLVSIDRKIEQKLGEMDIPDVTKLATKKLLSDTVQELKTGFNDEIVKVQTAVQTIATETETKIKALTPPASKPWYATLLD